MVFYILRVALYEIPYIGGRARNRPRPRAPSLTERPNGGHRRGVSLQLPQGKSTDSLANGISAEVPRIQSGNEGKVHKRIISAD